MDSLRIEHHIVDFIQQKEMGNEAIIHLQQANIELTELFHNLQNSPSISSSESMEVFKLRTTLIETNDLIASQGINISDCERLLIDKMMLTVGLCLEELKIYKYASDFCSKEKEGAKLLSGFKTFIHNLFGELRDKLFRPIDKQLYIEHNKQIIKDRTLSGLQLMELTSDSSKKLVESGRRHVSLEMRGVEIREAFHGIGGEEFDLELPANLGSVNGVYVSQQKFRECLKRSEGELVPFSGTNGYALVFPAGTSTEGVLSHLETLKGLDEATGWKECQLADGRIAIIPRDIQKELMQEKVIQNGKLNLDALNWDERREISDVKGDEGTIVLTSGVRGLYEKEKHQILKFLFEGMNVISFNPAGYGRSQGNASQRSWDASYEAVYQYLTKTIGVQEDRLLFKALCFSSGPTARLARAHPRINLLLDQGYSDFQDLLLRKGAEYVGGVSTLQDSKLRLIQFLAPTILKFLLMLSDRALPDWKVNRDLRGFQGRLGVIVAQDDALMDPEIEVGRILGAVDMQQTKPTIVEIPGEHGSNWNHFRDTTNPKGDLFVEESDYLVGVFSKRYPETKKHAFLGFDTGEVMRQAVHEELGKLKGLNNLTQEKEIYDFIEKITHQLTLSGGKARKQDIQEAITKVLGKTIVLESSTLTTLSNVIQKCTRQEHGLFQHVMKVVAENLEHNPALEQCTTLDDVALLLRTETLRAFSEDDHPRIRIFLNRLLIDRDIPPATDVAVEESIFRYINTIFSPSPLLGSRLTMPPHTQNMQDAS